MATMFTLTNPHNMHAEPISLVDTIRDGGVALVLRTKGGKPQIGQKSTTNAHLRINPRVLVNSPAQIWTYLCDLARQKRVLGIATKTLGGEGAEREGTYT